MRLEPLLPPTRPTTRRPNRDHRTILNGIRWRLRTGVPWRDLPDRYGKWETVYSRFRRWQQAGIWDRVLAALVADGDASWTGVCIFLMAPPCALIRMPRGQTRGRRSGAWAEPGRVQPLAPPPAGGARRQTGHPVRRHLQQRTESCRGVRVDRDADRERKRIERLKQHRAIATRYGKLQETFHALITIAAILLWL